MIVVLAAGSHVWLHTVATQPMPAPVPGGGLAAAAPPGTCHGLASVGQFSVPLALLLGAGLLAYRQHARK
jgi:hypothetical protein